MTKVGVILSGCGVYDGSEIHESVITLVALSRQGADVAFYAPDVAQLHVIDHAAGAPAEGESRNVLVEASRIARGAVTALADASGTDCDAWILPGGFGAAKNLSSFAIEGAGCTVNPQVERVLREANEAGRPLGFMCIAPAIAARVFPGVTVTIGADPGTAAALESMGATHQVTAVTEICEDADRRIVTAPAYMCEASLGDIATGIEALVARVVALAR